MADTQIRVRFAPSPTGALHVGSVRTALFNWLFARQNQGVFILRFEDTDVARSNQEFTQQILEAFEWLELDIDEGPYFQSQRLELYREAVRALLAAGKAYKCFCSPEELEAQRERLRAEGKAFIYTGKCRSLSSEQIEELERKGIKSAVRLKVNPDEVITFQDIVFGTIKMEVGKFGDFIIQRSDGMPTYNLAVVVDDHAMKITHVIRGDDHISNTPKQILVYRALGYGIPQFAHLPLILGPDRTRLSKRHGATSVLELKEQGFLPEAILNFLALLGWAPDETTQIMSRDELIRRFSLEQVSRSAAVFDTTKLIWMNGYYMRNLPEQEIIKRAIDFFSSAGYDISRYERSWLEGIIRLEIERSKNFAEMLEHLRFFLDEDIQYEQSAVEKHLKKEKVDSILQKVAETLSGLEDFSQPALEKALRGLAENLGIKFGHIVHPLRVAITGRSASPGIFDVLHFLGKERTLKRIHYARQFLITRDAQSTDEVST